MSLKNKFLIIFTALVSLNVFAQTGVYTRGNSGASDGNIIKWTITLNQDGTFLYHFFRDVSAVSQGNNKENFYGKGTWKKEGKIVVFSSDRKNDFNEKYTVNLNNSKARYITKSPRDKSDRVVKTALRFYESETFHIEGLTVFKE